MLHNTQVRLVASYVGIAALSLVGTLSIYTTLVRVQSPVVNDAAPIGIPTLSLRSSTAEPKVGSFYPLAIVLDTAGLPISSVTLPLAYDHARLAITGSIRSDHACEVSNATVITCTFPTGSSTSQLLTLSGLTFKALQPGPVRLYFDSPVIVKGSLSLPYLAPDLNLTAL